jgi:hypothetical protein
VGPVHDPAAVRARRPPSSASRWRSRRDAEREGARADLERALREVTETADRLVAA